MSENPNGVQTHPWRVYTTDRPEPLVRWADEYRNEWVAWSADGTRIVAHHVNPLEVVAMVKAAGLDSEDVVLSYTPPEGAGETLL